MGCFKLQEPDDPDAPDEHESSPPEDAPLYPHSPGSQYQQVKALSWTIYSEFQVCFFFFSIYDDLNCRHLARMLLWNTMFGGIKVKVQLHFTRSSFTIRASGENFIGSGINHPQKEQRDWCHPSLVYTEFDSVVFIDIDDILWVAFLFSNIKSSLKAWIWITGRLLEKRKWLCCHVTRAMNSDLQILSTYKIQICFYVKCLLYPMESQMWKKS